jgi:hypothetical protein
MREVKLATKNQIVSPREIRDALGVKGGRAVGCLLFRGGTPWFCCASRKILQGHSWHGQGTFQSEERESWQ